MEINVAVTDDSVHEGMLHPGRWVRSRGRHVCSSHFWARRLPLIAFLRGYNISKFTSDAIAGLTIGLTFIPGVMAASVVAGLPTQLGLYASVVNYFTYALLGSCKDVTVGPIVLAALLCTPFVDKFGPAVAITLCFYTGCAVFLIGLLNLGFLMDFISAPVMDGFLSAAALVAIANQTPGLLGISRGGSSFIDCCVNVVQNIAEVTLWDTLLGLTCMALLYLIRYVEQFSKPKNDAPGPKSTSDKIFRGILKYFCLGRTSVILIISTVLVACLTVDGVSPVSVAGEIEKGFPEFKPPPFTIVYENRTLSFGETVSELSSAVSIPLIVIVNSIASSNVFANGKTIDTTQEMLAVGVTNIVASFVQGLPASASVVRAVVNNAAGVQTTLAGAVAGGVVLLALSFFSNFLEFFPSAALSAVVICSVTSLIKIHDCTLALWRSKKADLIPLQATFYGCLVFGLDQGMIIGIGVNLLLILYEAARPKISVEKIEVGGRSVLLVTPDRSVTYPAAEYVKSAICKAAVRAGTSLLVVVNGHHVNHVDSTSAKVFKSLMEEMTLRNQQVVLWNWREGLVRTFVEYNQVDPGCFHHEDTLELLITNIEVVPHREKRQRCESIVFRNGSTTIRTSL